MKKLLLILILATTTAQAELDQSLISRCKSEDYGTAACWQLCKLECAKSKPGDEDFCRGFCSRSYVVYLLQQVGY